MPPIPYDASLDALNSPGLRPTVLTAGVNYAIEGLCAEFARLAYIRYEDGDAERQQLEQALALVGFQGAVTFNYADADAHAFGAVRHADGLAVLAFRGTDPQSLSDIADDVTFNLIPWTESAGEVHAGFAGAARGLREAVESWLNETVPAGTRLALAGHSLGAAIATLFASVHSQATLVTIGSPRVGDPTFVATLDATHIKRYVDCCDLITELPPPTISGYVHAGASNYITREGKLAPDADDTFVQADRSAAREDYLLNYAWRIGDVVMRDLADHAPINYVRSLMP